MKKIKNLSLLALILVLGLVGCNRQSDQLFDKVENTEIPSVETAEFKIGLLVGSGGVEDGSFNEAAWEGIVQYVHRYPEAKVQKVSPKSDTLESKFEAAEELLTIESNVIIALGSEYNEVVEKLQTQKPEVSFILIDGDLDKVNSNTALVTYSQQEASFLAGIAAAMQSPNGKIGFIGGAKEDSVQKYGLGLLAGISYANKHYNTQAEIVDYQYQGDYQDVNDGAQLAQKMIDSGVDTIFAAARMVGYGVINEAMAELERDNTVYYIGSDSDQYEKGRLRTGESVVLTSAIIDINRSIYELLDAYARNEFPGGQTIKKNIENGGVGLPEENFNLLNKTEETVEIVKEMIKTGELVIPEEIEALIQMIEENGVKVNSKILL